MAAAPPVEELDALAPPPPVVVAAGPLVVLTWLGAVVSLEWPEVLGTEVVLVEAVSAEVLRWEMVVGTAVDPELLESLAVVPFVAVAEPDNVAK